ncbi:nucleolar DEAD-box protein required for synthesis of 60S ribosomal subunit [Puccinia graminis f. sp. tritici]|uniref:RNA helicase n=2 Tax=Puccinia graminis f. sp. tritici TaxID=56615 RepID=A0A5B0NQF3_PUCGR|nr:nucleolar DEAD-box protein required for synthesis of 60S ribosomal subunit [Puccinia graminis f. sp. tritici]
MSDFIFTIDSEDEETIPTAPSAKHKNITSKKPQKKPKQQDEPTLELNPNFLLDGLGLDPDSNSERRSNRSKLLNEFEDPLERFRKKNAVPRVSIDEIVARHKKLDDHQDALMDELEDWKDDDSEEEEEEAGANGADEEGLSGDEEDRQASPNGTDEDEDVDFSDEDVDHSDKNNDETREEEDFDSEEDGSHSANDQALDDKTYQDRELDSKNQDASSNAYFDQSVVPFDPATKEELVKDSHDQPFSSLPGAASLSRPVLLGLSSMSITSPTPIQRQAIPLGLLGKDLVCSSVTGSGKTLGYMVPIVERLIWRDKKGGGRTRVMILTPTRELAVQVFQVGKLLARFTDLTFSLCVGGMDLRTQEAELRERPEIVIGTPGRVIDHIRNTRGFSLETLEILVIDEADRILEEGFQDELEEIISNCPRSRQTMLFSATVNESVADLAKLSLDKPIRIKIDPPKSTAAGLTQEFLKVKDSASNKKAASLTDVTRQAILVTLCKASAFSKGRTIIFFRSKVGAHRMKIIFSLFSLKAEELHGNLNQQQRLAALQKFKDGETSFLLATDLASRGLDIKGVERVINYEPPTQYDVYLHRIGRTARAGTKGSALTLVGESDRKLIKEARKNCLATQGAIKNRRLDPNLVKDVKEELEKLSSTIAEIIEEEKEEKELRNSEMQMKKCQNLIEHEDEIKSRPARTWFQSESEKKKSKKIGTTAHTANFAKTEQRSILPKKTAIKRDRFDGLSRKQKRRKMGQEEDAKERLFPAINSSIRAAKKSLRPSKITARENR